MKAGIVKVMSSAKSNRPNAAATARAVYVGSGSTLLHAYSTTDQ